jgi:hypothetical protein
MNICVTYFGDGATYLPLLEKWLACYKASRCTIPVVILTDLHAPVPLEARSYWASSYNPLSYLRLDPMAIRSIIRPGMGFDFKGSLICQSLPIVGRTLIVDIDAFFLRDPTDFIMSLPMRAVIGMGEDPATRQINGIEENLIEKNAGVLYFGDISSSTRSSIASLYSCLFNSLKESNPGVLLEQVVWTVLHHRMPGACPIPRQLNWSKNWKDVADDACIFHEHGPRKWKTVHQHTNIGNLKLEIMQNDIENARS